MRRRTSAPHRVGAGGARRLRVGPRTWIAELESGAGAPRRHLIHREGPRPPRAVAPDVLSRRPRRMVVYPQHAVAFVMLAENWDGDLGRRFGRRRRSAARSISGSGDVFTDDRQVALAKELDDVGHRVDIALKSGRSLLLGAIGPATRIMSGVTPDDSRPMRLMLYVATRAISLAPVVLLERRRRSAQQEAVLLDQGQRPDRVPRGDVQRRG